MEQTTSPYSIQIELPENTIFNDATNSTNQIIEAVLSIDSNAKITIQKNGIGSALADAVLQKHPEVLEPHHQLCDALDSLIQTGASPEDMHTKLSELLKWRIDLNDEAEKIESLLGRSRKTTLLGMDKRDKEALANHLKELNLNNEQSHKLMCLLTELTEFSLSKPKS